MITKNHVDDWPRLISTPISERLKFVAGIILATIYYVYIYIYLAARNEHLPIEEYQGYDTAFH